MYLISSFVLSGTITIPLLLLLLLLGLLLLLLLDLIFRSLLSLFKSPTPPLLHLATILSRST